MSEKIQRRETQQPEDEAIAEPSMAEEVRDRWIAIAAYYRAAQRGFVENHELEDWVDAENEFNRLMANKTGEN